MFLKASETAELLRSNLREEQDIMSHFTVSVRSLTNSYQIATCIVRVSPECLHAVLLSRLVSLEFAGLVSNAK